MARSEILPADAGSLQSQTQSQGANAKQKKKPIEAGGKEFADVGSLRAAARELKLVAASPLPNKSVCIQALNEYQKLKEAEDVLDSVFAEEDIPFVDRRAATRLRPPSTSRAPGRSQTTRCAGRLRRC